jgi:hemoglobin
MALDNSYVLEPRRGSVTTHERTNDLTSKLDYVSESAIARLVDEFYRRVRMDPKLAPIFERASPGDWGPHLATMRDFWSSVMLTSGRYKGIPVARHLELEGLEPDLFDHWLGLFAETCRDLFNGELAALFSAKARRIAASLELALFYRPDRPWSSSLP